MSENVMSPMTKSSSSYSTSSSSLLLSPMLIFGISVGLRVWQEKDNATRDDCNITLMQSVNNNHALRCVWIKKKRLAG